MANLYFLSFLILIESLLLGALFLFTFMGFPSWLKIALARIRGKQYVLKITRDNALSIEGAREVEGVYKTEHGAYELEPEDSFTFNGSSGALWFAPYNQAILPRVMPLLRDLKRFGISHYGQLIYFYNTPIEKIRDELGEAEAEKAAVIQSYEGKILQDLEVIRVTDLKNFLEARSPAAENGIIERYVNIERRKLGNPLKNSNVILFIIMAGLLGLCLGYIMAGHTGGGSTALNGLSAASTGLQQVT